MSIETTPKHGLKSPMGDDFVKNGDNVMRENNGILDDLLTPYDSGLLADIPTSSAGTPGIAGRTYRATDDTSGGPTGTIYLDYGTGWIPLNAQQAATISTAMIAAGAVTKAKLATDALNAFLKLATAADVKVAFGNATLVYPNSGGTIAHGLGGAPTVVLAYQRPTGDLIYGMEPKLDGLDDTNMHFVISAFPGLTVNPGAQMGMSWLAIR